MQKVIALIVIVALTVVSAYDCNANLSGDNNASPARWIRSSSCNANLSGDNNASPARSIGFRTTSVCSGKGGCVDGACVCNAGFQGENCEHDCTTTTAAPSSTTAPTVQLTQKPTTVAPTTCAPCPCGSEANLSGDNNASPARSAKTACPVCKVCSTVSPSTAAPITTTFAPTTTSPPVQLTPKPTVAPSTAAPTTAAPVTTAAPATTNTPQTSQAPTVGLPICGTPEANLSGDNNASPARNIRSSSCNINLSGDNNASPARRFRNTYTDAVCSGKGGCVNGGCVCNVGFRGENCEEQYCVVATVAPSVNLTTKPTTTSAPSTSRAPTQNESGDDNSRETSGAASTTTLVGLIIAALVALSL